MGYKKTAVKGVSWVGSYRVFNRLTNFARTAILARLLTPTQFGVFGVAAIVLGLLEMLTETGINVFLIQEEKASLERYLNTAWVTSIIRGTLISLLITVFTPSIASFFDSPTSISLIYLIALVPFIRGFINPSTVNFQKQFRFQQEFWYRSTITIIDSIVAIIISYKLRSPIGLVWGLIAGVTVEALLSHLIIKPRPRLTFQSSQLRFIISRGKWITGAGILQYLSAKASEITIGKLIQTRSLGIFQNTYRLAVIPIEELIEILNRVSFPIYVKITHNKDRTLSALRHNYALMLSLSIPFSLLIFFFSNPIIQIVLGSQWTDAVPLMRALSPIPILIALNAPTNPLFLAHKKQHYLTYTMLAKFILIATLIIPFTIWRGIIGAAYATSISIALIVPLKLFYLRQIIIQYD